MRIAELAFLGLPARGEGRRALLEARDLLVDPPEAVLGCRIALFTQGLSLDLQLDRPPVDFVQFFRFAVNLHTKSRGCFVDEVDRLVGQEPIGDVPVRQRRGGNEGRILDAHAVVKLVLLLEAAQDRHRVFNRRLGDEYGLEAAGEGRILFDMLAVLIERGRADAV